LCTHAHQRGIEHALALQQPFPDQCHHHRRQQHRIEEHAAPEAASDDLSVEHQRGDQRQQHHQHDLDQAELHGIEDGAPEHVLAAGLDVEVVAALEQDAKVFAAGKRPVERHQVDTAGARIDQVDRDRQKGEQPEHDQVGCDEQPAQPAQSEPALGQPEQRLEQVEEQARGAAQPGHGRARSA
jgi:hypothetical protein